MPSSDDRRRLAEKEVAQLCEQWWRRLERDCEFRRRFLGGARSETFKAAGDLMTSARRWPFNVEVRQRAKMSIEQLIDGRHSCVWGWWCQVVRHAQSEGGAPMLWLRKYERLVGYDEYPWLVLIPSSMVARDSSIRAPDVRWSSLLVSAFTKPMLPVLYFSETLTSISPRRFAHE